MRVRLVTPFFHFVSTITLGLSICGCASSIKTVPLHSEHDLTIEVNQSDGTVKKRIIKAGERFQVEDRLARISAPGRIPAYWVHNQILPTDNSAESEWKIQLPPVSTLQPLNAEVVVAKEIDDFYATTIAAIELSRSRNFTAALTKVDQVISQYPNLAGAQYLRAEILAASGAKEEAIRSLNSALRIRPGFTQANELRNKLQDGERR